MYPYGYMCPRLGTSDLTPALYFAMTNHFCAVVLFEYSSDMDHESDAKYII